ncbi:hypothetical protein CIT25_07475 [Mesorhizobium mediterraneum]|uniref:Secreted protein n=1 Tax=Mesorhizobium mediterraneum TaxID=43617 RepID=A0AB36RFV4_9HYPH|nr:hypothetical protein CIT25_07475 [Mesorhizobium mediterraneum]
MFSCQALVEVIVRSLLLVFFIVLEKLVVAQGHRHHIAAGADGMMPNSMKMSCGTGRVMAAVLPKQ